MSVAKMTGVSIVGTPAQIEKLSRKLLSGNFFEPMPLDQVLDERVKRYNDSANPYDAPLEKLARLWKAAEMPLPTEVGEKSAYISPEDAQSFASDIQAKLDEHAAWSERVRDDRAAMQAVIFIEEALALSGHTIQDLRVSENLSYSMGPILVENWERFCEVSESSPLFVHALVKGDKRVLAFVIYPSEYAGEAHKIFDAVHFQEYTGSSVSDDFENIDAMRERFGFLDKESRDSQRAAARFIEENREMCERRYTGVCAMQRIYALLRSRGEASGMTALSGFVPHENVGHVRKIVKNTAPDAVLITEDDEALAARTQLPTLMKNNKFAGAFQEIVNLYSLPHYGEFDPSTIVAFTFCLFFGMMFGDVGHGAALVCAVMWLERKGIMSAAFSRVLKIAGGVSMVFGVLYGSVFGDEEIIPALWLSPMRETNNLIAISVAIGIVFLSLGMILKIYTLYKKKEWGEFYFGVEGIAGVLFYWTACVAVVRLVVPFGGAFVGFLLYTALIALFVVIALENYLARKFFHHSGKSDEVVHAFSIFHAMLSFVSNSASFVRLAAFALNHAGLSMAVYMLADMVRGAAGGKLWVIIVVLFGNLLIVALEGLIVFIQTLRLEYYEFFSKFFTGGGRPFSPVAWKE